VVTIHKTYADCDRPLIPFLQEYLELDPDKDWHVYPYSSSFFPGLNVEIKENVDGTEALRRSFMFTPMAVGRGPLYIPNAE